MPESGPNTETPKNNVLNKFVTRVWEHPLVTELTRQKRAEAFRAAHEIVREDKGILLVPVGSSLWVSGEDSDVDFLNIRTRSIPEARVIEIENLLDENRLASQPDPTKPILHAAGGFIVGDRLQYHDLDALAVLFLTPDEYISGDHDLLRQLRLKAVDPTNYTGSAKAIANFGSWFNAEVQDRLHRIKEWPVKDFGYPYDDHYIRWKAAMDDRAAQSNYPRKWQEAFHKGFSELRVPDFESIRSNIQTTGGEIHLDSKYKAKGL